MDGFFSEFPLCLYRCIALLNGAVPRVGIATNEAIEEFKAQARGPEIEGPRLAGVPVGEVAIFGQPGWEKRGQWCGSCYSECPSAPAAQRCGWYWPPKELLAPEPTSSVIASGILGDADITGILNAILNKMPSKKKLCS
jgi:hypothetical protein